VATILIVDDHPVNRELLVSLLGHYGHRILESADGKEALTLLQSERPDLAIVDILLPTMDGYELVRRMRQYREGINLSIIFYSAAYNEQETRKLAKACGVDRFLSKPCEPETILATVDSALAHAAPPARPPQLEEFDRDHLQVLTNKLTQKVDELEKMTLRMQDLIRLSRELALETDPLVLLQRYCREAHELVGVRSAAVKISQGGSDQIRQFFTSGLDAQEAIEFRSMVERINPSDYIRDKDDAARSCRTAAERVQDISACPIAKSILRVPLKTRDELYGALFLADKIGFRRFPRLRHPDGGGPCRPTRRCLRECRAQGRNSTLRE
jgi:CheY-like chemotaxis protein